MIKKHVWIGSLALLFFAPLPSPVLAQTCYSWTARDVPADFTYRVATSANTYYGLPEILVAGRMLEAREVSGFKAYMPKCPGGQTGFWQGTLFEIAVDEVFKGEGIQPGDTLPVIVLFPAIGQSAPTPEERARLEEEWADKRTQWQLDQIRARLLKDIPEPPAPQRPPKLEAKLAEAEILDYYERTGDFPPDTSERVVEPGPKKPIPADQPLILSLFSVDFVDPEGNTYWAGLQALASGRRYYGYNFFHEVGRDEINLRILRNYFQIVQIENPDARVRRLAEFSLDLLRNGNVSEELQLAAVENLVLRHSSRQWGQVIWRADWPKGEFLAPASRFTEHYLTSDEFQELAKLVTDRSRSSEVRINLMRIFNPAEKSSSAATRRFKFKIDTFLRILQDSTDAMEVRDEALRVLGELGGPEVEEALGRVLLEKPVGETEEEIHRRIRNTLSSLQKEDR